jgi:hypothetical protein
MIDPLFAALLLIVLAAALIGLANTKPGGRFR